MNPQTIQGTAVKVWELLVRVRHALSQQLCLRRCSLSDPWKRYQPLEGLGEGFYSPPGIVYASLLLPGKEEACVGLWIRAASGR